MIEFLPMTCMSFAINCVHDLWAFCQQFILPSGWIEANIKSLVLDEVRKMFDRNSDFLSCYEYFKGIKDRFLIYLWWYNSYLKSDTAAKFACWLLRVKHQIIRSISENDHVQFRGKCQFHFIFQRRHLVCITGDEYSMVYMDYRSDVELMSASLKLQMGEEHVRTYYGSGMMHELR